MELLVLASVTAVLCAAAWLFVRRPFQRLPLPPGPKSHPVIGSVFQMPVTYQWLTFDKWIKEYGDIVYTEVLGNKFLILGSAKRTNDFFVERSAIYSDRVLLPMMELMGWGGWNITTQNYGPWWKTHRRTFDEHFRANAVPKFYPVQMRQVRGLLKRLLDTPEDFRYHIRHTISSIILSVTYGIRVMDKDDPYINIAEEAMDSLAQGAAPGAFLVDLLPALKYVPRWFPGASFQRKAAHWRWVVTTLVNRPWKYVKDSLVDGTASPCVTTDLLEALPEGDKRAEQEQIAKNCAGVAYVGGADTTASSAQSFVLAMAMYPEVQRKAQAELDAVIGHDRLPNFNDLESLPFINAVVKETLRWQPVLPMGVAHCSMKDDEYEGFFIPKGSIVIGNSWTLLHDPDMYPEPEEFRPDRFLKDDELNPDVRDSAAAFGYGRRICPGQFMATRSLFAIISSVLWAFDISPPLDALGNAVKLRPEMSSGLISYPLPYKCVIKPRSETTAALVRDSADAA